MTNDWKLGHRPGLDGLRGVAVLMVMLAHFQVAGFSNAGRTGVSVFFVLSGFLITALLLEEHSREDSISLRGFWRRRFVRLLPALALLIAVAMALPLSSERPSPWALTGVVFYMGNWVQMSGESIEPFGQMWSLAVEEQFYVVWPIVVLLIVSRWSLRAAGWIISGMAATSLLWRVWLWNTHDDAPNRIYAATDTNALLLLAGCALAVLFVRGVRVEVTPLIAAAAGVMLLVIGGILALLDPLLGTKFADLYDMGTFRYVAAPALVALLAAAAIAYLAQHHSRVMTFAALVLIGRLSYGLYLWHWLVVHAYSKYVGRWPSGRLVETVGLFVVSFALAGASWLLVERPMMRFKASKVVDLRDQQPQKRPWPRTSPMPR